MTYRAAIEKNVRLMVQAYPVPCKVFEVQAQLATCQEIGDILRPDHPGAAEIVDVNSLLLRAQLADLLRGP